MDEFETSSTPADETLLIRRTPRDRQARYPAPGLIPEPGPVRTYALAVLGVPLLLILLLALHPWSWAGSSSATDTGTGLPPGVSYGVPAPGDTSDTSDTTDTTEPTPTEVYYPTATSDPYAPATDAATDTDTATDMATDTASATPSASATGPAGTVTAYFDAINSQDYETAWNLGGKNLDSDYNNFVAGFTDTQQDAVTILSVDGGVVSVDLVSTQTDGSQQSFSGSYTVAGNAITSAQMQQTG